MLIPVLVFFYGIPVIRMARAATKDVVALDFVTAARARGESRLTIVKKELFPNVLDVLLVEGAMRWSWMLLAFSSLSFLGFGVAPPTPDWGLMISDSRGYLAIAPWTALAPVAALSSPIIGINLSADALAKEGRKAQIGLRVTPLGGPQVEVKGPCTVFIAVQFL